MRKRSLMLGCLVSAFAVSPMVHAVDGLVLELGHSSKSTTTYRLGAQFDFGRTLWQNQSGSVQLDGRWDAGVTRWSGLSATTLSLSPVFTLNFPSAQRSWTPYLEAGIGAAYFTKTELRDRDLGSKFQFEDRIGAGVRLANGSEFGLRFYHYSNAGIKKPNDGIETAALYYRMNF